MNEHIEQTTNNYTTKHKERVRDEVYFVKDTIEYEIKHIEEKLKLSLEEKIEIALDIATFTYETYKDTLNKEQIKSKIAQALEVVKFNDGRRYYFMYDNKTKIIFGHPMEKFIGKDMSNYTDAMGLNIMESDAKVLAKNKIAFNSIYFNKPDNQKEEFPKITCITKFEPLDLVLGVGEYLDVVREITKKATIDRFSQPMHNNEDKYLVILDIHDLEGGDEFATVLLNSNESQLVGNKVSDKGEDVKGNSFRKDFLDLIKKRGEGYVEYWYNKPSTGLPTLKISYIYFQKDWNWLILSGFYYEDLEEEIAAMREDVVVKTNDIIQKTLILVILLSIAAMSIAMFVSIRIDKIIKEYTDKIIAYEDNKRKQEALFLEQSKLASMGEMISNIAHQWRQPLATISMGANNIIADVDLDIVENQTLRKNAKEITEQTIYLSKTIDDFRNFIKGNKEKKGFNLSENIKNFMNLVQGSVKNNNINIILELQDDIELIGHENELIQCLINIFHNAKDAFIEKGVAQRFLFISTFLEDNNVIIKIKDNAGGIPEEILPKIFEPYFTTKFKSQGTGLGLHMTYSLIVNGMAGRIEVQNVDYEYDGQNYQGAQFAIILPTS